MSSVLALALLAASSYFPFSAPVAGRLSGPQSCLATLATSGHNRLPVSGRPAVADYARATARQLDRRFGFRWRLSPGFPAGTAWP